MADTVEQVDLQYQVLGDKLRGRQELLETDIARSLR